LIANIIVDVPAFQTDIPYSYLVKKEFEEVLQAGMRVVVPFGNGNRLVQGFVVDLADSVETDYELKEIQEIMDLHPVINEEMMQLADFMKEKTFSFKISCLQTMLPAVMRADYAKYLVPTSEEIPAIFNGRNKIDWQGAIDENLLPELMKLKTQGQVEIRYEVNKRNKVKKERYIKILLSKETIQEELEKLSERNLNQKKLLDGLLENSEEFPAKNLELSSSVLQTAVKKGWIELLEKEVYRESFDKSLIAKTQDLQLNDEQAHAKAEIIQAINEKQAKTFLLEGITGSGKTEVYLQVIKDALAQGKSAIVLVPEISLTPMMTKRFTSRFGNEVAVLHSALSLGEKYDEWRKIERGEARVVVGARSAVFAPLKNIGVIIIDEEHEATYKQDSNPRYHARDIAIWRGAFHQAPVVLASATPTLESRARAQKKVYEFLTLTQRASSNAVLPSVQVVDFRKEFGHGNSTTFTQALVEKMKDRLSKGEQTVLMLNRRGFSSFMMCRTCGDVLTCPNCDISLTLHMDTKSMRCHYCGHEEHIPQTCPSCQSREIRYYGTGTQKVEKELSELLPQARILRMDVDTTKKKGSHERILKQFEEGKADILLGTQMIAKGLDFENVTLVGVLNADTSLNLPDFRSSERTFQLVTQVSGRAGRGQKAGEVVIQTYNPEHYAVQLAAAQDYEVFYRKEMSLRHLAGYPPYFYTVQVTVAHKDEMVAAKKIFEIYRILKSELSSATQLLGPSPKSVARIKNQYLYQIIIKYKFEERLTDILKQIVLDTQQDSLRGVVITIDNDPLNFM